MAKKSANGVNRSAAIRELLAANPEISGKDAIAALKEKGVKISSALFYLVKGKTLGSKKRRGRKAKAVAVVSGAAPATPAARSDALATIRKVKAVAGEVGGMRVLKSLIDALSE